MTADGAGSSTALPEGDRLAGLRCFAAVLLALTALHIVLAVALPVSGDEAYYWDCSRHAEWSTFDQPKLVIWAMVPFRAVLGETRLAVRAPAVVASLLIGLMLLPLARRLGGTPRHAALAYLVLHLTPLMFLGSFYASTDIAMAAAYLGAAWAAVALAQGERRAWWGFGIAAGLGFLAKFPIVTVLPAVVPAILRGPARGHLRTPVPYLAAALSCGLTLPVWVWAVQHDWDNIRFQLQGRHTDTGFTLTYLGEYLGAIALLLTPFLLAAFAVAWWRWRRPCRPDWLAARLAAVLPLALFAAVGLRTRVSPHWGTTGVVVAAVLLVLVAFRGRSALVACGAVVGLGLSVAAVAIVLQPERLLAVSWSYRGQPRRISTGALAELVGNDEIVARLEALRRPDELVASESYSDVHLYAFLSGGRLPTRLANIRGGKHGLASLYWYRPGELAGRDMLFVTDREGQEQVLRGLFEEVRAEPPIEIERDGKVIRSVLLYRCRSLLRPEGAFTRLK
ncbi:MAG TPA: glycosyltransferase family 39 protein [Thermoanaerobaculales bacterium]|nr:glycosyltransferase family 39 protein [Thermoanaerobaculales bacterium]